MGSKTLATTASGFDFLSHFYRLFHGSLIRFHISRFVITEVQLDSFTSHMERQPTTVEIIIKKLNQLFLSKIKYATKATGSKGPKGFKFQKNPVQ